MFQYEHPHKIAQSCRDDQVDRLADKDARCGNRNADRIVEAFKNCLVPPASQPPCDKADDDSKIQLLMFTLSDFGSIAVPELVLQWAKLIQLSERG